VPFDIFLSAHDREIVIYGTGGYIKDIIDIYTNLLDIISFFVSNDYQTKPTFYGKQVCSPDILNPKKHLVLIAAPTYREEISDTLDKLGFLKNHDYFFNSLPFGFPFDRKVYGVPVGKYSYSFFNKRTFFDFIESIGRFTSINDSAQISINHPLNTISTSMFYYYYLPQKSIDLFTSHYISTQKNPTNKVKIGNDVWIGANVFINTSNVSEIGDGAIIGTGAVVLENVPPYSVVLGTPAKITKYRYTPEQIEILLRVKWWDWDNDYLSQNAELLIYPDKFFEYFANN
jgi:aminocyclitol acetyltransferase